MKFSSNWTSYYNAITWVAIEAAKAAVQEVMPARTEVITGQRNKAVSVRLKMDGHSLKQLTFNWSSVDKCAELRNFRMVVKKMFQSYSMSQAK